MRTMNVLQVFKTTIFAIGNAPFKWNANLSWRLGHGYLNVCMEIVGILSCKSTSVLKGVFRLPAKCSRSFNVTILPIWAIMHQNPSSILFQVFPSN
ncbi:hypothetical protein HNY73_005447 [Argiope bruennichi]|uniref:Uncharacterized protein n=1 Tax=Argiope bruennichi TaxID=94029 RepID=A0A8T0FJ60_ARGBR|nr:hypothetical protein HNY73_005447 [Argiope bruennichi]